MEHDQILMQEMAEEFLEKFPEAREAYEAGEPYSPLLEEHPFLKALSNCYHAPDSSDRKLMETLTSTGAMKEARRALEEFTEQRDILMYLGRAVRAACDEGSDLAELKEELISGFESVLLGDY